jgi:translation initiation factor IF-1
MRIVERLSNRHYRATLPNGKEVIAHLERKAPADWRDLPPGSMVVGELSPYDFEHARLAGVLADGGDDTARGSAMTA